MFGEDLGSGGKMFGAVAELASAEALFPRLGETLGRGEVTGWTAKGAAEAIVDLPDLDDLLQRRADEVGKALPGILTERTESRVGLAGGGEPRIPGGRRPKQWIEIEVEAEVALHRGGGKEGVVPNQLAVTDGQSDGVTANPAGELAGHGLIPAEGLAAQEGSGQIERRGELQGRHDGEKLRA